jgi:hypothetical protein
MSLLHFQVISFTERLTECDLIIRDLLYVGKATPFLTELGKVIDLFKENLTVNTLRKQKLQKEVPLLQEENQTGKCNDLDAFTYVVQLLTGELLGHEYCVDCHSEIQPIVRREIPEINNVTELSCNQQNLSNYQDQTDEKSILWNCGIMIPATYSAEISDRIQQLRTEILSHGTARGWQQCGFHTCSH